MDVTSLLPGWGRHRLPYRCKKDSAFGTRCNYRKYFAPVGLFLAHSCATCAHYPAQSLATWGRRATGPTSSAAKTPPDAVCSPALPSAQGEIECHIGTSQRISSTRPSRKVQFM